MSSEIDCWICHEKLPAGSETCWRCGNLRPANPPTPAEMAVIEANLAQRRRRLKQLLRREP